MEGHGGLCWEKTQSGVIRTEGVKLSEGCEILEMYLGPGGLCAIADGNSDAESVHCELRTVLATPNIVLYLAGKGRLESRYEGKIITHCSEEEMREQIDEIVLSGCLFSQQRLEDMLQKLIRKDAYVRGYYVDSAGQLYLKHNKDFQKASDLDSELLFRLTAFGGGLGLHRFYSGQLLLGTVYALTCGLFLFGWISDLFLLFVGCYRDKRKFLVCPLERRTLKFQLLIFLIPFLALSFWLYTTLGFAILNAVFGTAFTGAIRIFSNYL